MSRFVEGCDRTRVHVEDFAQVFGVFPEAKYQRASYRKAGQRPLQTLESLRKDEIRAARDRAKRASKGSDKA